MSEVLSKTDYEKLTPLIDYIEQNGSIKPKIASDICQKSPSTVRRYLNMLTQTGYVIAEGKTSNMVYKARIN